MAEPRTGAERYFARQHDDAGYRAAYERARKRIDEVDEIMQALDERRRALDLSKADLARRAGVKPEAVRRLFSAESPNPTLNTLLALAGALDLELRPRPRRAAASSTRARSAASGTRRRAAVPAGSPSH